MDIKKYTNRGLQWRAYGTSYFLALFAVRKLSQMINQMNERYHLSYYFAVPQKNAFFIKTSYQKHFQRTVKRFRKQSFTVFQAIGSTRKFW